jgi:hypothetical protein
MKDIKLPSHKKCNFPVALQLTDNILFVTPKEQINYYLQNLAGHISSFPSQSSTSLEDIQAETFTQQTFLFHTNSFLLFVFYLWFI